MEAGKGATSDEVLIANAIRTEIDKNNNNAAITRQPGEQSNQKRARSSERLLKLQQQQAQSQVKGQQSSSKGKSANLASPATRVKPKSLQLGSSQSAKSAATSNKREFGTKSGRVGGSNATTAASLSGNRSPKSARVLASQSTTTTTTTSTTRSPKMTRMASGGAREQAASSEQPIAQVVRMTDAQALTTAQTLASILMSRCMMSTNCAHLLDVCSTKQASFSLPTQAQMSSASNTNDASDLVRAANWSLPFGLSSSQLMSLAQSLQADRVLRLFPLWRETIETIMDNQEAPNSGYTIILPSNEAIDQVSSEQVQAWNANSELLTQIIDNHILDFSESFEVNNNNAVSSLRAPKSRYVRSKSLQVNQHRDRMITLNGKRLIYANQLAPGE